MVLRSRPARGWRKDGFGTQIVYLWGRGWGGGLSVPILWAAVSSVPTHRNHFQESHESLGFKSAPNPALFCYFGEMFETLQKVTVFELHLYILLDANSSHLVTGWERNSLMPAPFWLTLLVCPGCISLNPYSGSVLIMNCEHISLHPLHPWPQAWEQSACPDVS